MLRGVVADRVPSWEEVLVDRAENGMGLLADGRKFPADLTSVVEASVPVWVSLRSRSTTTVATKSDSWTVASEIVDGLWLPRNRIETYDCGCTKYPRPSTVPFSVFWEASTLEDPDINDYVGEVTVHPEGGPNDALRTLRVVGSRLTNFQVLSRSPFR